MRVTRLIACSLINDESDQLSSFAEPAGAVDSDRGAGGGTVPVARFASRRGAGGGTAALTEGATKSVGVVALSVANPAVL